MSRQGAISGPLGYISDVRQGGREVQAARTLYGLPWRPILGMLDPRTIGRDYTKVHFTDAKAEQIGNIRLGRQHLRRDGLQGLCVRQ